MFHSMSHTYPLAMGHKNADHKHIGKLLRDDLLTLASDQGVPMYSKLHGGGDGSGSIVCLSYGSAREMGREPSYWR
jgi:hypothetical protein